MEFQMLDWSIIALFFGVSLGIGIYVARQAGQNPSAFFAAGHNMPWWLLGVSMVATTFAADTPLLVTQIVRENGIAGNWEWWAFLLTGLLTTFAYARLWRRAGLLTDLEFYEIRYSGKPAAFLRGFRAVYLGLIFNVAVLGAVCLAAVKLGGVLLGLEAWETLVIASVVTVVYSALGGLKAVLLTDLFQFGLALIGSFWAASYVLDLPQVGGLSHMLEQAPVSSRLDMFIPLGGTDTLISLVVLPLAVQWWASWYPGSEPGGGGYVAQRMLAAKSEKDALGASLFFNVAHYAIRPWPWIIIALASIMVFPDLASLQEAFPNMSPAKVKEDLAYAAMLRYLPAGLAGLVVASLIAAFMSTLSTHLNWGASYLTNDVYKRFVKPDASDKELVWVGRLWTVVIMLFAAIYALYLQSAKQAFDIIVLIGAGTGLLFILRWFWWRINAYSEIVAMIVSFSVAVSFEVMGHFEMEFSKGTKLLGIVGITTVAWLLATFLAPKTERKTLESFVKRIRPAGPGWKAIGTSGDWGNVPTQLLAILAGCVGIYGLLFASGYLLYGNLTVGLPMLGIVLIAAWLLRRIWNKI
ncbi:MAG: sodium:solute symporter family protein [Bacteroidia bacterium]